MHRQKLCENEHDPQDVFLCLGANLGEPRTQIEQALLWLEGQNLQIVQRSSWYTTEPVGWEDQPWFVNLVVHVTTCLAALDLLDRCQEAERRAGRQDARRFGPRVLDIDLLLYGDLCLVSDRLVLPHPRMHERRFVLIPLLEISPDLVDPLRGVPYAQTLRRLDEGKKVQKLLNRES